MKFVLSLLLSLAGCMGLYSQTPADSLVQASTIIDGLFFDNSAATNSIDIPEGSSMILLTDPDGGRVLGIYLPEGTALDEATRAKAIAPERIRYAAKLLRDYIGRRPQPAGAFDGIGTKAGEPMTSFEYPDIDGNLWNNDKLRGKTYVINIWQSECGPCRREMPVLSEWKERFPDVVFLSASRHNAEEILPVVTRHKFTWTHLQEASALVALVGQKGFPLTVVVDRDGIVRFAKVGASEQNQAEAVAVIEDLTR